MKSTFASRPHHRGGGHHHHSRGRGRPSASRGRTAASSTSTRQRQRVEDAAKEQLEFDRSAVLLSQRSARNAKEAHRESCFNRANAARGSVLRAERLKREAKEQLKQNSVVQAEIARDGVRRRQRATAVHLRAIEGVEQELEQRARADELRKQRLDDAFQARLRQQIVEHEEWVRDEGLHRKRKEFNHLQEQQEDRWADAAQAHEAERKLRRAEQKGRVSLPAPIGGSRERGLMEKRVRSQIEKRRVVCDAFSKSGAGGGRKRGLWEQRQRQARQVRR